MNSEKFILWISDIGASLGTPPQHPFRAEWEKIKNEIAPHFYGTVPDALKKAFPNEDSEILKYRKSTYQAKTESPLVKSITELSRMLSSAKHSVRFDSVKMTDWFKDNMFESYNFTRYFFNIFVQNRVIDPNAVLLVRPIGEGVFNNKIPVKADIEIIQSERIVFNDPEYNLLIYKAKKRNKYSNKSSKDVYNVVTDEIYGTIFLNDENKYEFVQYYAQTSSKIPWVTLGGRAVPMFDSDGNKYTVYKSDVTPAISYLNDAAIYDNQFKSVTLSSCFPLKFLDGVECTSCHGMGKISEGDEAHTCGTCKGAGKTMFVSPLAGYFLNPTNNTFPDTAKQGDPIRFFSPETGTIEMTRTIASESLAKAEEVLNINRSLKQAQSGTAKELDREPEYIETGRISDDVYAKMKYTLEIIQGLVYLDYTSKVIVNAPISFDLKNETELLAEFKETQLGMPTAVRFEAYRSFMERRFASDPVSLRIAEICPNYCSVYLNTIAEISEMLGSGQIDTSDAIKANFVFSAVQDLYYTENFDIFTDDFDSIKQALDRILAPRLEQIQAKELPDDSFDDMPE